MFELKKDPWVLGLAGVVVVSLTVLTALGKVTWQELAGGLVLLGLPSLFGKAKEVQS